MSHEAVFARHRSLLFTVAYEVLGSVADAEDVVQETWLRWAQVDLAEVREPRAYLVRISTRQALNRMRTLARRRESYVGPWLPEPLLIAPDAVDDVLLADEVSTAMLLVLETLGPVERLVFVLREVFDVPHDEIAAALDRTPEAVRQTARRARSHVAARRPRMPVEPGEQDRVTARFLAAVETGDLQGLVDVLAPDVVLLTDGGGLVQAARRPILGVDKTLRFLIGIAAKYDDPLTARAVQVSGGPGLLLCLGGRVDTLVTWRVDDGRVTELYAQRNPAKLRRLAAYDRVMASRASNFCIDAHDPYAQTMWWAQVLEDFVPEDKWEMKPGDDECGLDGPDDRYLLFLKVPEPKTVKNRMHLCVRPTDRDRDAEVDRILALGATMVDDRRDGPDKGWAVLADPEGNEFCVLRRHEAGAPG